MKDAEEISRVIHGEGKGDMNRNRQDLSDVAQVGANENVATNTWRDTAYRCAAPENSAAAANVSAVARAWHKLDRGDWGGTAVASFFFGQI